MVAVSRKGKAESTESRKGRTRGFICFAKREKAGNGFQQQASAQLPKPENGNDALARKKRHDAHALSFWSVAKEVDSNARRTVKDEKQMNHDLSHSRSHDHEMCIDNERHCTGAWAEGAARKVIAFDNAMWRERRHKSSSCSERTGVLSTGASESKQYSSSK